MRVRIGVGSTGGDGSKFRCPAYRVVALRGECLPAGAVWVPIIRSCALTRHDALASWEPMYRVL